MPLTSADALALSKSFRDLSVAIGDFRFANWDALGDANRKLLENEEWSILNASSDMVTKAVGLGLDESDPAAKKVQGATASALKAVKTLTSEGIHTNVTLIFSANQALLAAKAGATYASPFVGRLDDISEDGMEMVNQILEIYENYDLETEVLVASVRNPIHVLRAARMGADIVTLPLSVMEQLAHHPLTDIGLKKFLADWEKVPKK